MMFGDNLGDFIDGSDNKNSSEHRMEVTKKHQDMWGNIGSCCQTPIMVTGKVLLLTLNTIFQKRNSFRSK